MEYKFYRITEGVFMDRAKGIRDGRDIAIKAILSLCEELGAKHAAEYSRGGIAHFEFGSRPDKSIWKVSGGGYMPKVSTKGGKEIQAKIKAIPKFEHFDCALDVIKLDGMRVFGENAPRGMRIHRATWCGRLDESVLFIRVPQHEESPYVPADGSMVECKEWEMLKFMDSAIVS